MCRDCSGRDGVSFYLLQPLTCRPDAPQPVLHRCDLRDASAIDKVFEEYASQGGIWAVVHLAALKAVGESGEQPLSYYRINVGGTISLLEVRPN